MNAQLQYGLWKHVTLQMPGTSLSVELIHVVRVIFLKDYVPYFFIYSMYVLYGMGMTIQ